MPAISYAASSATNLIMTAMLPILATITAPTGTGDDIAAQASNLNDLLASAFTWAGAVVLAYGILRLILSMSDTNPGASATASLTIAGGICMLFLPAIIDMLDVTAATKAKDVAGNALTVIGNGMTYAGAILIAIAVFQYFLSLANQQGGETAQASRLLGTAIALLAGSAIAKSINSVLATGTQTGTYWAEFVITGIIGPMSTYIGAGFLISMAVSFVMAFRDTDASAWTGVGLRGMVGIALVAMPHILQGILDAM